MKKILLVIVSILVFSACSKNDVEYVNNKDTAKNEVIKIIKPIVDSTITNESVFEENIVFSKDIALVYASKSIGKYAIESSNVLMLQHIANKESYNLNMIDIEVENTQSIQDGFAMLKDRNISKVILLLRPKNLPLIFDVENLKDFKIFVPLSKKENYESSSALNIHKNLVYGSIDYVKQFDALKKEVKSHIIEIYDESAIGLKLHNDLLKSQANDMKLYNKMPLITSLQLKGKNPNYKTFLKYSKKFRNASVILNTSIVKSSIIMSQIIANDIVVKQILSTQVNYSPSLFKLTQANDRKKLLIANSISALPEKSKSLNIIFGNNILYNWVNTATLKGLEYLNDESIFLKKLELLNNQVVYDVNIVKVGAFGFKNQNKDLNNISLNK